MTRGSPDTYNEVFSQGEYTDNRYWFPSWDYPNDRFTYTGRFEAPEGYKVSPTVLATLMEAWTYTLEQDMVNYLVMLAVAPYKERLDSWRGQPVRQWYPPDVSEAAVEHVSGKVPEMLELFSQLTAFDYPYPIYTESLCSASTPAWKTRPQPSRKRCCSRNPQRATWRNAPRAWWPMRQLTNGLETY